MSLTVFSPVFPVLPVVRLLPVLPVVSWCKISPLETERTHHTRPDSRRAHYDDLHRGKHLSGSQGRPDLRLVDPGRGDLDGASKSQVTGDDSDRDLSPPWILALTALCLIISAWLAFTFARSTVLGSSALKLTLIAVPFVLVAGFLIAGICGYMAGLIGA